jgi:hypothetical protein
VTWLAWRQFRANALLAVALTAAVVVVLVLTRSHIAAVAHAGDLSSEDKTLRLLGSVLVGLPAFIGAFWGAPLVARELESGTYRLAWTQGITRTRWLATKLALTGAAAVAVAGAYSLVYTWWSSPLDELGNRIGTANFGQRGIAPVAYALFALALGVAAGTVLRRTLPAMATAVVGFVAVRFALQSWVRPHLLGTVTRIVPTTSFGEPAGAHAYNGWVTSTTTVDAAGHALSGQQIDALVRRSCHVTRATDASDLARCARGIGMHDVVTGHPGSQFWALQLWESLAFLALTAALVALAFWWLRRRTA